MPFNLPPSTKINKHLSKHEHIAVATRYCKTHNGGLSVPKTLYNTRALEILVAQKRTETFLHELNHS